MISAGIITYHAAYNYGSVLQAYATQESLRKLGISPEIINYRPPQQCNYYRHLYRTHNGMKVLLKDLCMMPARRSRLVRMGKFEEFIHNLLKLSTEQYTYQNDLQSASQRYDVVISGSDQILNKHSNELESEPWTAMNPYLLTFVEKGRKISYASSTANMTENDIERIANALKSFSFLSSREADSATLLQRATGLPVENVLDPTLLLSGLEWSALCADAKNLTGKRYLIYYSLDGTNKLVNRVPYLKNISRRAGLPIILITPFGYVCPAKEFIDGHSIGPLDFLSVIKNAELVITDSYHGTLFSINFNTPFWSISNGSGSNSRKDQILQKLNLMNRVIPDLSLLSEKASLYPSKIDEVTYSKLSAARNHSIAYLRIACGIQ